MRNFRIILLFVVCFIVGSMSIVQAANRVIDDVEIVNKPSGSEIHVFFNAFFQVSAHNPKERGDYLQVELRPVRLSGLEEADLITTENVVWEASENVPLVEITYTGESSFSADEFSVAANRIGLKDIRSQLKLRFRTSVPFNVHASADLRGIVVVLPKTIVAGPVKEKRAVSAHEGAGRFAINLMSTPQIVAQKDLPSHPLLTEKQLYQTEALVKGQKWYRWRLGFFGTKQQAEEQLALVQKLFPNAWVVEVASEELEQITQKSTGSVRKGGGRVERKVRPLAPERLNAMLNEAKKEMTAGNYNRAIQLYSRILQHPDPVQQQEALEILGLARERKGQLAHAKALYEEYLARFPEGEGAQRVQQRLTGMLTARSQPKATLRKARKVEAGVAWEKDFFGSVAQYYQYDESTTDGEYNENVNALTSDADLNFRLRNEDYDIEAVFVGSNENDFSDEKDDEARVSTLSLDFLNKNNSLYGRVGRQTLNTGGVLGRFDGFLASYQILPQVKVNGVYGYPVESSRITKIDNDKHFYGINFDLGTFADQWDYNLFFIEQEVDGIIDRRAVGGEMKFYDPTMSLFTLVDYDIYYNKLNTILVVGNWKTSESTTFNAQVDFKRSPLLTTSNALQGQSVETIEALKSLYSEDEIDTLADDRTATTTSMLVGVTHDLNQKWQLYADATQTNTKGTVASGGVDAIPGTGDEYFYNVQLIGNSLMKEGDLAIFGVRYSDLNTRNSILLSVNGRYPVTHDFRVNPRIRFEYREDDDGNGDQTKWTPLLRFDYRLRKDLRLELETGSEFTRADDAGIISTTDRYWILFRYRFLF